MKDNEYLIIDTAVLPDIYEKVVYATSLLESGEAVSTSEAVRMAGISRSVYYKYKDGVFPYQKKDSDGIISMQVVLKDKPGALMTFLSVFSEVNANILTVNQNIPVKGRAFVTVSARAQDMTIEATELVHRIKELENVIKIDSIIG
ncbi:MAG: ACT domain-containing protein [Clostridia bacterium]|nr:ACT domain-containing protein [Clostridia bacterium]